MQAGILAGPPHFRRTSHPLLLLRLGGLAAWREILLTTVLLVLRAVLAVSVASEASAAWDVRTLTQTMHVLRDEALCGERQVTLAAARNEWQSFQILMRSDAPVEAVNVEAVDLVGPQGAALRAADARLYRQHQLHVSTLTYRNKEGKPGWYPDPLIPFTHPLTRQPLAGGRLTAVPFELPAGQTHGFLVDLYVPADAKAGLYRGTYRVTSKAAGTVEIPVTLTVWGFELPLVPTLQTAFGSPAHGLRGYYQKRAREGKEQPPPADWDAVDAQCAQLLSEHRINATPTKNLHAAARPDGTFAVSGEQITALREFVDKYHVNAIQIPHPEQVVKDPEREKTRLYAWLAAWDRAIKDLDRPQVVFYIYLKDEPNDEPAYRYVQKWGRIIRRAHSLVKVLVVEQPQTQDAAWGDLYGAVDIWCPLFSLFEAEPAAKRQALGETIWTYTALCQGEKTPWWHTDFPLLHYRVPAWIAWRYRIRGLLYWGGMSFWEHVADPWTNPETYDLRKEHKELLYNGEGSLVYPGRAVGYDGIVASMRLKALRDSIEDYEYLAIAERTGLAADAEKVVLPLAGSWYHWEADPAAYQKARAALAEMILRGQARGGTRPVVREH
jgi:hypothetical protein